MRSVLSILFLLGPTQGILFKEGQQAQRSRIETCSPLKNHLTYSSVKVSIGTPPQYFHLVADTGSNNCIVKDCQCTECPESWGNCFTGQKKSKSFDLPLFKVQDDGQSSPELKQKGDMAPAALVMSFGSGQIAAQIASDEVGIGSVRTYMDKGLLLMVNHALNLEGPFEGILGLGRPGYEENVTGDDSNSISVPGFFDSAHIQRFSMCFNPKADGVLGINTPEHANRMKSVGRLHWGLDFHGISIGKNEMKVAFCDPKSKKEGMETACGIIPDSGTTLISGSEAHISLLFEDLCKQWERCTETHRELLKELKEMEKQGITISATSGGNFMGLLQEDPEALARLAMQILDRKAKEGKSLQPLLKGATDATDAKLKGEGIDMPLEEMANSAGGFDLPPALTLQLLLEQCSTWSKEVDFNEELPELVFHVAGAGGNKHELIVTPRNYVLMRDVEVKVPTVSNVLQIPLSTTKMVNKKVCMMAFNPSDFATQMNGDVWIMGTPLFYEYTAHYDRGSGKEKDIGMGFTPRKEEDCGSCEGHKITRKVQSLVSSEATRINATVTVGLESLRYLDKQPVTQKPKSYERL